MDKEELYQLYLEHSKEAKWEKYDFVDPPYCWSVSMTLEVDGYLFTGDGDEVCGYEPELRELYVKSLSSDETIRLL